MDAPDRRMALAQLERLGHVPVSVTEGGAAAPAASSKAKSPEKKPLFKLERRPGRGARLKLREVLLFTRELCDLLSSGMTLGKALHTLAKRKANKATD